MRSATPAEAAANGDGDIAPTTRAPARRRSGARWLALALILVLLGAGGGYSFLQARHIEQAVLGSVKSAQTHLERGKNDLKAANKQHNPALLDAGQRELRAGIDDFRRASQIAHGSRLAQAAGAVPLPGSPIRSRLTAVDDLAEMGIALSQAALKGADVDRLFVSPPGPDGPTGAARVLGILDVAKPIMPEVQRLLEVARAAAARIDPGLLTSSQRTLFASVKDTIAKGLSGVQEFNRLAPVIADVLGANGPRTYLVEQVNPFELRAGGGYIGTYSLIRAEAGALRVVESGDTHDLPDFGLKAGQTGYIPPPATLSEFLDKNGWNLSDSNFFPTFDVNAKAALDTFGQRDFGQKVDGVIALDSFAVRAILQLTGAVQVDGTSTQLDAQNLFQTLIELDITNANHKQVLGALAGPLMSKVTGLGADHWPQLLDVLNQQASQRHIQAYFTNDTVQQEFGRLGWSGGASRDRSADFLYPLESNFGGNKANFFLTRHYTLDLSRSGNTLHHRVQIAYSLDLSQSPPAFTSKWAYRMYLRMFVPQSAANVVMQPVKGDDHPYTNDPAGAIPQGAKVVDGWQQINPDRTTRKGTMQIVIEYDTQWSADSAGRHQIYWQTQPGTDGDKVTVHWTEGGKTTTANGALTADQVLTLGPSSVTFKPGHIAQGQLPKLSF